MTGKTVIVTGARVAFAVRDTGKGTAAAAATPGDTEVRELDLASLASVRAFAAGFAGPSHVAHMRSGPELIGRSAAQDADLALRLWAVFGQLTGVRSLLQPVPQQL